MSRDSTNTPFPRPWLEELASLDAAWKGGDATSSEEVTAALALWRRRLRHPATPEEEWFDVVDPAGAPRGWRAPRWFCHLTGLRHRVVHALLTTPQGFLTLQMRAHDKAEWPSRFDTTVGGHLKAGQEWQSGMLAEIEEEMGLQKEEIGQWLAGGRLETVGELYLREGVGRGVPPLRNRQLNQLFTGQLTPWGLAHLHFADGEVSGAFLCPPREVKRMIEADFLIAPGLKHAFGRWWEWRRQKQGF